VIVDKIAVAIAVLALPGLHEDAKHPALGYLVLGALFGLIKAFLKPILGSIFATPDDGSPFGPPRVNRLRARE
jgi:hypothetical protein